MRAEPIVHFPLDTVLNYFQCPAKRSGSKRAGVHSVSELLRCSEADLLDIANFDAKSIHEIKANLADLDLSLKDSSPEFEPMAAANDDSDRAVPESPVLTTPQEWRSYLHGYSELYLRTANEYQRASLEQEREATCWMGADPAAEETVLAAEHRLGVQFPRSFRSFLLTSDGWSGVGGWVDLVYPCERVFWMRDTDRGGDLIDIYGEYSDQDNEYVQLFRKSLEVASGEDIWLLDPTDTSPDGEWAAYRFAPKYGEFVQFASFAELFHDSLRTMEELAEDDASDR